MKCSFQWCAASNHFHCRNDPSARHSPPTGEGLDSFLPPSDTRQDMKDLLLRMKQLVGEFDRLLENSK